MRNNYMEKNYPITIFNDADAALQIVREFDEPAAVAVKHMNPCGVGTGATIMKHMKRHMKQIQFLFSVESLR